MLGKRAEHHTKRDDGQHSTYYDRPIDIDILLFDRRTICLPRLTVPHPLMKQRDFVMKPLLELLCRNGDEEYLRFLNLLSTQYLHN